MTLEFDVKDLKHLKNYLVFAHRYLTDQYNRESSLDMAKVIKSEIEAVSDLINTISNFIMIWG